MLSFTGKWRDLLNCHYSPNGSSGLVTVFALEEHEQILASIRTGCSDTTASCIPSTRTKQRRAPGPPQLDRCRLLQRDPRLRVPPDRDHLLRTQRASESWGSIDAYGERNDFHQLNDQGYDPGFPESFRVDKTVEFHHSPNSYTTYNIRNYSAAAGRHGAAPDCYAPHDLVLVLTPPSAPPCQRPSGSCPT